MSGMTLLIGCGSVLFCTLAPGWAVLQILNRLNVRWPKNGPAAILVPFALGVHVNAAIFLACWIWVDPNSPRTVAAIVWGFYALLIVAGVYVSWRSSSASTSGGGVPGSFSAWFVLLLAVALVFGSFAALQFPSVLDSAELLYTQLYVSRKIGGALSATAVFRPLLDLITGRLPCPPMLGFSGILLEPGLLLPSIPLATTAASLKVVLAVLVATSTAYVVERLDLNPLGATSLLLFGSVAFSQFGLSGMVELGKDSIFSLPFLVASLADLAGKEGEADTPCSGLFLSSAIFLGSVAVPYALVFLALYVILSGGSARAVRNTAFALRWTTFALPMAIGGVRGIFPRSGSSGVPLWLLWTLQIGAWLLLERLARVRSLDHAGKIQQWIQRYSRFAPVMFILGAVVLFPLAVPVVVWFGANGEPITEIRAPLDGSTEFWGYFLMSYSQNNALLMGAGLASMAIGPILLSTLRQPAQVAFFAFLPATIFVVLLQSRLSLNLLPGFNVWDITKDVPQWFGGMYFGLPLLMALERGAVDARDNFRLSVSAAGRVVSFLPVLVFGVLVLVGLIQHQQAVRRVLTSIPHVTGVVGHERADLAQAFDFTWANLRGRPVFVSEGSNLDAGFYSYQMYGASGTQHFAKDLLTDALAASQERVGFFVSAVDLPLVVAFSERKRAEIKIKGLLDTGEFLAQVSFNGQNRVIATDVKDVQIGAVKGAFPVEKGQGAELRWMKQEAQLEVLSLFGRSSHACFDLDFVNPFGDAGLIVQVGQGERAAKVSLSGRSWLDQPVTATSCLSLTDGYATLHLSANQPGRNFPGDSRSISFGLLWPPHEVSAK
jgi:hypothetical protein